MARPRAFDLDTALDRALHLFWRKGYEGTSISDLTAALAISRPSLYSAFGSKEGLFDQVVARYVARNGAQLGETIALPTARDVVERLLFMYAGVASGEERPGGCLLVQGALVCGAEAESVRDKLQGRRSEGEVVLRRRLERAQAEGDLSAEAKPKELSRYIWSVCYGMSVLAAGGSTRRELRQVAAQALAGWPGERSHRVSR